jgi:hypothetical protein
MSASHRSAVHATAFVPGFEQPPQVVDSSTAQMLQEFMSKVDSRVSSQPSMPLILCVRPWQHSLVRGSSQASLRVDLSTIMVPGLRVLAMATLMVVSGQVVTLGCLDVCVVRGSILLSSAGCSAQICVAILCRLQLLLNICLPT